MAIVTGAAQGIGLGTACVFAREGAMVVLSDAQYEAGLQAAQGIAADDEHVDTLWLCRNSTPLVGAALPSIVLAAGIQWCGAQESDSCGILPGNLRCEYLVNPLGLDELQPRLSWKLTPTDPAHRGLRQTEYQILVASSHDSLDRDQGSLRDSGHVASDQFDSDSLSGLDLPVSAGPMKCASLPEQDRIRI